MKIDYMIGDWVVYQGDTKYDNPIKIEGMDIATDMLITSDRKDVGFNGVEPIPLTAEILEKNDFRNSLDEWYLFKGCLQMNFTLKSYDDTNEVLLPLFNGDMQITYVHELQHALKLCKIDKTIKL